MQRKDIEYVLRKLGQDKFKYTSDWVMTSCPLAKWTHSNGLDRKPSFGVHESKGISSVNCFGCQFTGGMISLIHEVKHHVLESGEECNIDFDELVDFVLLAEESEGDSALATDTVVIQPVVPKDLMACLGIRHKYIEDRGISSDTARKWNLGWSASEQRVLFPIYGTDYDRPVGIAGRTVIGADPKWKNYPEKFKKSDHLYGEHFVADGKEVLIVVEGQVDVVIVSQALDLAGLSDKFGCVGLMGSKASVEQRNKLLAFGGEIVCMLDNDHSGKIGTKELIYGGKTANGILDRTLVSRVVWEDTMNDAGELLTEQIIALIHGRQYELELSMKHLLG